MPKAPFFTEGRMMRHSALSISSVGNVENLFQNIAGVLNAVLFVLVFGGEGHCRHQQRQQAHDQFLHRNLRMGFRKKAAKFASTS